MLGNRQGVLMCGKEYCGKKKNGRAAAPAWMALRDLLFVDADTGGVFAYRHDGMEVEPGAESLAEVLAGSRAIMRMLRDAPVPWPAIGAGAA